MSICSGTPSRLMPSSSAVSPQRSSDSVKTSLATLNVPSSRAICSTVSTSTRLISSCSTAGTVENAAVSLTSAIGPYLEDIGMRLGRVGADGEADGLAQLVLAGPGCPGTCQVALGSVGVAHGQVGRQVAERRRLGIEGALLVLPARDDFLFQSRHDESPPYRAHECSATTSPRRASGGRLVTCSVERIIPGSASVEEDLAGDVPGDVDDAVIGEVEKPAQRVGPGLLGANLDVGPVLPGRLLHLGGVGGRLHGRTQQDNDLILGHADRDPPIEPER